MTTLLCAAIAATNAVAAQPSVTVYATRIDDARDAIPASVSIIGAADIESSGARDLPDLLKKKAGIDVHSMNGNPILASMAMRGFGDNAFGRMKVVLDGEELNNVDMNAPNLTRIPLGRVTRIEVIRGPSPVLYGDGAIAGTVNVVTDCADYGQKTKIEARAGSQNTFGGMLQTKGGVEDEGLQYGASYDYRRSGGYRDRSAWNMHTANAAFRKNFENGSTAGFKANYQNSFYELPGSLTYHQWKHGRKSANNRDDWTRQWSYGFGADSKLKLGEDRWLHLDGTFSHQHRRARMSAWGTDTAYDAYAYSLSPRYVDENDIFGFGSKFTIGADFRYDSYTDDPFAGRANRFGRTRGALFAMEEFYLTDTLSAIAGVRVEEIYNRWVRRDGSGTEDGNDVMADFELGLVYRPVEGIKTYVKGTRFHRSAFCDELNYTRSGKFLDPETGTSFDIGAEWTGPGGFSMDVNGYGMVMEDEIFFDPLMAPYGYNRNSPAKTRRIGMDAGLSWRQEGLAEASLRYGVVKADFDGGRYDGCEVPYVPNHRVRLETGVWVWSDLEVKGGYSYTSSQYPSGDFANDSEKLPAYSLFDAGVYYSPSWVSGWKASFTIDNLFDRNYCDYAGVGYYYPACGRNFLFALSCEF